MDPRRRRKLELRRMVEFKDNGSGDDVVLSRNQSRKHVIKKTQGEIEYREGREGDRGLLTHAGQYFSLFVQEDVTPMIGLSTPTQGPRPNSYSRSGSSGSCRSSRSPVRKSQ